MSELNTINGASGARLIIPFVTPPPLAPGSGDKPQPKEDALSGADEERAGDRFEVSAAGAALASLQEPDDSSSSSDVIRVEKVARVRSEVQNGIYDLEGKLEAVLDRILEDLA